jgi:hypothetical protein
MNDDGGSTAAEGALPIAPIPTLPSVYQNG